MRNVELGIEILVPEPVEGTTRHFDKFSDRLGFWERDFLCVPLRLCVSKPPDISSSRHRRNE